VTYSIVSFGLSGGLSRAVIGLAVGLAVWTPFYVLRLLGAGDVKLFAASAAWLGLRGALEAALLAALIGGALALFWMLRVRGIADSLRSLAVALSAPSVLMDTHVERQPQGVRIPYGVALAVGAGVIGWWPGLILGR
jgi:prepilin peptidase CpaA